MVIQPGSAPERVAPFGGIDRAEAVECAIGDGTQRDFSGRVPFSLSERSL